MNLLYKRLDLKKFRTLKIAVVFNLKKEPEQNLPEDYYAEFDNIAVPKAIKAALEKTGYPVELLEADENLYQNLKEGNFNFVFNLAEGIHGESRESHVPAILEMLGIPYTGSGILTQAITLDKTRTKECLLYHGVATPSYQLFNSWNEKINPELNFPLFVKPNSEGSSKGIRNNSLVSNEEELRKMVRFVITTYHQPALVEEFLKGREFTVAVMGNTPPKVMPIVEVTFDYLPEHIHKFDSYEVKWIWDSPNNPIDPVVCPAKITKELEKRIIKTALKTYKALGIVDLCRMDMRLDSLDIPNVIEVNALPGLMPDPTENSRFPKACFTAGMKYDDIINTIFSDALERYCLMKKVTQSVRNANRNPV